MHDEKPATMPALFRPSLQHFANDTAVCVLARKDIGNSVILLILVIINIIVTLLLI